MELQLVLGSILQKHMHLKEGKEVFIHEAVNMAITSDSIQRQARDKLSSARFKTERALTQVLPPRLVVKEQAAWPGSPHRSTACLQCKT